MKLEKITWYKSLWRILRRYDDYIILKVYIRCNENEIDELNNNDLARIFNNLYNYEDLYNYEGIEYDE